MAVNLHRVMYPNLTTPLPPDEAANDYWHHRDAGNRNPEDNLHLGWVNRCLAEIRRLGRNAQLSFFSCQPVNGIPKQIGISWIFHIFIGRKIHISEHNQSRPLWLSIRGV